MADIDRFKKYNDKYGHPFGDQLLKDLGNMLGKNTRREDTVARIGGEEFVVVLPGIKQDQVVGFGERLRRVIEEGNWSAKPITVSLGAATYQFTSKRTAVKNIMKRMISQADQALYESKSAGRNCFRHFEDLDDK